MGPLRNFAVPASCHPPASDDGSARWTPATLDRLAAHLAGPGAARLAELPRGRLEAAWQATVTAFRDPASPERRCLDGALAGTCELSRPGLEAGLEAVLGGVGGPPAAELFRQAAARRGGERGLVVALLAANLPALAVQPLLPTLALARPVLLKSPSAEPLFAPAFVVGLAAREPALGEAVAAVTWRGGDRALEAPVLAAAERVLAYGEAETLADLARRATGKLVPFGPKTSVALVGTEVEPVAVAAGLARDVALFDQRGCLSVTAVFTTGDPEALGAALAAALADRARCWPPGPVPAAAAAAVHQLRGEAALRSLPLWELPLPAGTVVVEPEAVFRPGPGVRTVRIHPVRELSAVTAILEPWVGRLQGAALAGAGAWALAPRLAELGVSRSAPPGELQSADALWHNGGRHPLEALGREEPGAE